MNRLGLLTSEEWRDPQWPTSVSAILLISRLENPFGWHFLLVSKVHRNEEQLVVAGDEMEERKHYWVEIGIHAWKMVAHGYVGQVQGFKKSKGEGLE